MVGIYKKIKQILKMIQTYAPLIDKFAPGIGALVGSTAQLTDNITDGINNVYEDYSEAKNSGQEYGFRDGLSSFGRPSAAMKTLTKSYGGLHPRLQLKSESAEEVT
jgi:hypothetical protein